MLLRRPLRQRCTALDIDSSGEGLPHVNFLDCKSDPRVSCIIACWPPDLRRVRERMILGGYNNTQEPRQLYRPLLATVQHLLCICNRVALRVSMAVDCRLPSHGRVKCKITLGDSSAGSALLTMGGLAR